MATTTARKPNTDPPTTVLHVRVHVRDDCATYAAIHDNGQEAEQLPARTLTGPVPHDGWDARLALYDLGRCSRWVWDDTRGVWWAKLWRTR